MAEVVLENVYKIYPGNVTAVKDVNLRIPDKEFVVLVGPSGCGKSTTLRMIAGLEEISKGTVTIDSRVVNEVPPKDRDIAMVFQNYALYPHMTVYENMAFGLKLRKMPRAEIDTRVREAAGMLGITEYLDRKPKALSGGQRQRVAVGRAIVRRPKAFLFDEPLSNLDAKMRVQMRTEIIKLHHNLQSTMIYVTHDQVEAMTMGDRIVVMKDGIIQQVAPPLELYHRPANLFVAGFIGSPPMNVLRGRLDTSSGAPTFQGHGLSLPVDPAHHDALAKYANRDIALGIRPEHVAVGADANARGRVEIIEQMGAEVFLYAEADGAHIVARIPELTGAKVGETVPLRIAMDKVRWFDTTTQQAIA